MRKVMCFIGNQSFVSKNMMQPLYLYSRDNSCELDADFLKTAKEIIDVFLEE